MISALFLLGVPGAGFGQQTTGRYFFTQAEPDSQPADNQDQPPAEPDQQPTQPPVSPPEEPSPEAMPAVEPTPSPFAPPQRRFIRLARAPNMFGDVFINGADIRLTQRQIRFGDPANGTPGLIDEPAQISTSSFPLAGGSRRVKISENDKALPQDRIFFQYSHFHNALSADVVDLFAPGRSRSQVSPVDRYIFGVEKTFHEGWSSVAIRIPFAGDSFDFTSPNLDAAGGETGNLAVVLKRLLYASQTTSVTTGLGIDTPTGSDATGRVADVFLTFENDAVHLLPYVGFLNAPNERFVWQMFIQGDFPTKGNPIEFRTDAEEGSFGSLNDQSLLFLDVSAAYWLYRSNSPTSTSVLTGLASVLELHYTSTLQDPDVVTGTPGRESFDVQFTNTAGRVDALNLTTGLHAALFNRTTVRVAGVFPLRHDDDKLFDAEFQLSVNHRY